jgi:TolA-binding protein
LVFALVVPSFSLGLTGCGSQQNTTPPPATTQGPSDVFEDEAAQRQLEKAQYHNALARQAERQERYEEATTQYRQAAESYARIFEEAPDHSKTPYYTLIAGQTYLKAGELQMAQGILESLAEDEQLRPKIRSEAMFFLAELHLAQGNVQQAYDTFLTLAADMSETDFGKLAEDRLGDDVFAEINPS